MLGLHRHEKKKKYSVALFCACRFVRLFACANADFVAASGGKQGIQRELLNETPGRGACPGVGGPHVCMYFLEYLTQVSVRDFQG